MQKKVGVVFALVLISLLATCGGVIAQTSTSSATSSPSLIALSTNQLSFYCQEGAGSVNRTINIVGLVNQTIDVTVIPVDLYDNNTGAVIPYNNVQIAPSNFTLLMNELQVVTISLGAHAGKQIGTYLGTILVTAATETSNVTVSNVSITAKIDIVDPVLTKFLLIIGILISFGVSLFMGLVVSPAKKTQDAARIANAKILLAAAKEAGANAPSDKKRQQALKFVELRNPPKSEKLGAHLDFHIKDKSWAKFCAIIFGLVAVFLWVYLNTGPGMSFTDTGNIFSTAVMVPLVGYLVALVTGKTGNSTPKTKP
jgi:hypothetical protein